MLLATDLDGTFLAGKVLHKQKLYHLIRQNKNITLVFVTGRGLESVIPLLNDLHIPHPDYIICDVGATIVNGHTLEPIEALHSEIEKNWPGETRIIERLKDIEGLVYQNVPQQRRCSFFLASENIIDDINYAVEDLGCEIIYSAGKFLDILPKGVNKGRSLTRLVNYLGTDTRQILVAGDTLNDLAMYHCGYKGVVVGNAERKLLVATKDIKDIYCAAAEGAGGILESLSYFGKF